MQIVADALKLAKSREQAELALQALAQLSVSVGLDQLEEFPDVMQRLAKALARVGKKSGNHAQVCEGLLSIVENLNAQMLSSKTVNIVETGAADKAKEERDVGAFKGNDRVKGLEETKDESMAKNKGAIKAQVLAPNANTGVRLTPLHVECLKQCLLSCRRDLYARAMVTLVGVPFDAFGSMVAHRARAFMEYHLYAGMVCVGVGALDTALAMWLLVFALPAKHASAIQIATYKRMLLLNLALHGDKPRLPAFFAGSHARVIESNAAAYASLAEMFGNKSMQLLLSKIETMRQTLEENGNWGLAQLMLDMMPRHFIKKAAESYLRIRVEQLVQITGFASHPRVVADGIGASASLVQYIQELNDSSVVLRDDQGVEPGARVVDFLDNDATASVQAMAMTPEGRIRNEQQWSARIEARVRDIEALRKHLLQTDQHLALTKEYASGSRDQATA
ncbi:hypothetical protein COEREDRAFT_82877 [Coemansia reversa NRRL 1564]|uniref:COP9 signalosome complex subunit 3 N-terminal helical repeats domain-containing protein n=1 Tax=Coemansia reversa (strain ATCC 12441 / NRRL 1564) TaxID=763665 RepID=A0A2G5B5A6_COERN|nr:hypothetical protein COEREDRAFT_82877 [Coemansia reversa NRRL 1564]|eukprot:PIA14198.1 hypothetical protein COEREDRAFT_82877 [Coemansia reversa NRRL 1564]